MVSGPSITSFGDISTTWLSAKSMENVRAESRIGWTAKQLRTTDTEGVSVGDVSCWDVTATSANVRVVLAEFPAELIRKKRAEVFSG